jgi:hypothetical protein
MAFLGHELLSQGPGFVLGLAGLPRRLLSQVQCLHAVGGRP